MSIKKGNKVIAGAPLEPVWGTVSGDIQDQADLLGLLETKADVNSATLTGTPTAPTPPFGSNNDRIATTSFVQTAIDNVDALPSQSGHNGQFLTTNGEDASWATVDALPSQSGQSGKFLTTNGTTASWGTVDLSGKRDIITNASRVYTTDNSGNQSEHYYSNTPYNNAIAVFDGSAHLKSSAPSVDNDVTTKKYVDDGLKEKLDGYNISVAGAWTGGVHAVKFVTVDYSGADSENGVFIRISMVNSHGNGITGRFYQDIILNVNYTGTVAGTIYRYFAEPIEFNDSPYYGKDWGDVFWTIDTTNKIVKFFVLMRQYSYTYETPYFRLNTSTKGEITQHSGVNSEEYSSGTQYWATIYDYNEIPVQTGQSGKFLTTNGTSVSWSSISQVPSQSGQSGKFLTTNGTTASWANVDAFPSQSGNNGKFLTTNGTSVSWASVDAFPTQAGNTGKFLTTDGSTVSWADTPSSLPSQSGNNGKFLTTNGTAASWASLPTYSSGTGITVSGTTINHSNSVTAGTAGTSSATSGSSLAVPYVTYDAQGHITASGTHTHTVTGFLTSNDIDQTYSGTSTNAQSGVAVKSAIDAAVASVYKPAGSVAFANKPTLSSSIEGNVYNITDDFTTTADFVEGTGHNYPAGTNIVCINTASSGQTAVYKWDVLAGFIDLSGYVTKDGGSSQQTIQLTSGTGTTAFGVKSRSTASYISLSGTSGWLGSYGVTSAKEPTFYNGSSYTLAYNIGTGTANGTISANGSDVAVKGLGSAAYTSSSDYQPTLVSGTNIKTINNTTILGSGNIDTHELPSQSGQSGKFLTTNGTEVSWGSFDESDLVHKSGDETITGTKSFEATLQLKNNLSFRSYGSNDSGRLQFRAQPSDNVIRGTVAITDGYSTSGSGYTGFVAQMVARAGSTTSEPFNTMRVSNKGIEYIKEANDGTITGQYILIGSDGIVPQARLASGGTNGQVLTTNGTTMSWATISQMTATYDSTNERITWA